METAVDAISASSLLHQIVELVGRPVEAVDSNGLYVLFGTIGVVLVRWIAARSKSNRKK